MHLVLMNTKNHVEHMSENIIPRQVVETMYFRNTQSWTTQKMMETPNVRSRNRSWGLMLDAEVDRCC
jgi:hypothetical protein